MDDFIFANMSLACSAISGVGAQKLWIDLCANPEGGSALYYAVIGFYVVAVLVVVGTIGNLMGPKPPEPPRGREEPR